MTGKFVCITTSTCTPITYVTRPEGLDVRTVRVHSLTLRVLNVLDQLLQSVQRLQLEVTVVVEEALQQHTVVRLEARLVDFAT